MTDRASRKRRKAVPVEPETPHIAAGNEGAPPAGHPGLVSPVAARMAAEGEPAKAPGYSIWRGIPGDTPPFQLPDGTWEVLVMDADGRVTGRWTVEGPK